MNKKSVSIVSRILLLLLASGIMASLTGCERLEAGIQPTPTAVAAAVITQPLEPTPTLVEAIVTTRPPEPTPTSNEPLPTDTNILAPVFIQQAPVGLVYQAEDIISVWETKAKQAQALLDMPLDASYPTLSATGNVAYVLGNVLYLDTLAARQAREAYVHRDTGVDWNLRWSNDGSTLAYAVAWNEADGSRQVELGTTDGYDQRVVATMQARAAGPTPTPPSDPSAPSMPGFANLAILGFDRAAGRMIVMPVDEQESKQAIWTYDMRSGKRVAEVPWPTEYISPSAPVPALSPDLSHLAILVPGTPTQSAALHILTINHPNKPVARVELPVETYATWLTWSPDSRQLAYSLNEGNKPGLAVSPSLGVWAWQWEEGQPRELTSVISSELALHGWTSDSQAIVLEALDGVSRQRATTLMRVLDKQTLFVPTPKNARVLGWLGPNPTENWTEAQDMSTPASKSESGEVEHRMVSKLPPLGSKPLSVIIKAVEGQGLGTLTKAEFDDGLWEVEVCDTGVCQKLYIEPKTGEEKRRKVETDFDEIPPANALPLSTIIQSVEDSFQGIIMEIEFEDGRKGGYWEIDLWKDGRKIELKIDPITGEQRAG